jgi:hypothetical protein
VLKEELSIGLSGHGERLATRILIDSLLRQLVIVGGAQKSDVMLTLVYLAILSANQHHVSTDSDPARRHSGLESPAPDADLRPISAHSLALSLGIPYETARRYIGKLIDDGRVARVKGGVIVPQSQSASDTGKEQARQFYNALKRLLVTLRRAGFDLEAMSQG